MVKETGTAPRQSSCQRPLGVREYGPFYFLLYTALIFHFFLQRIYILCTTKMFIFKRLKTNHILLLGPDSNSSLFMMFSLTYPTQNNPSCDRILIRIKITNHN